MRAIFILSLLLISCGGNTTQQANIAVDYHTQIQHRLPHTSTTGTIGLFTCRYSRQNLRCFCTVYDDKRR